MIPESVAFRLQGKRCFYCRRKLSSIKAHDVTRDHVYPKSAGHTLLHNKVFACRPCNEKKGSRMPTAAEIERFEDLRLKISTYRRVVSCR